MWAARYQKISPTGLVMAAKLRAIKDGFLFWQQYRPDPIKIFSDSMDAINALKTDAQYMGVVKDVINQIIFK